MQLDLSQDFQVWDNVQPCTLAGIRNSSPFAQTVSQSLFRPLQLAEGSPSGGAYQAASARFTLPNALLGGVDPRQADTVTNAAGTVYTVLQVEGAVEDQSGYQLWRLTCKALSIVFDLRDVVSIQRAGLTQDAAGGIVRHWPDNNLPGVDHGGTTPYQSISARVQLLDRDSADDHGTRGLRSRYSVIVDRQLVLTREDRVKVESWLGGSPVLPIYLDIDTYTDPARLDELPKLACVRTL